MTEQTIQIIRKFTEDRDWGQFHTPANLAKSISIETNELLECFQWTRLREVIRSILKSNKEFNIRLPRKNKEGEYDMCKAIQEIERKSELRGEEIGRDKSRIEDIKNLMKNLKFSAEQAMEALGIPKSEYKKYMTML